jgi:hypothetical protein
MLMGGFFPLKTSETFFLQELPLLPFILPLFFQRAKCHANTKQSKQRLPPQPQLL